MTDIDLGAKDARDGCARDGSASPSAHTTPALTQPAMMDAAFEPNMLVMFRMLPRQAQHQFVQLAVDEMALDGPAEQWADSFLAESAWQIEDGDDHRASELYPQGCVHPQTWLRHKVRCAEALVACERQAMGRRAMMTPRARLSAGPTSI